MEEIADTGLCIDRETIRANLSQMSFEELQKMKEKFGAKVYNETVHGTTSKKRRLEQTEYKRANKNRPREMSAKRPVRIVNEMTTVKRHIPRDPRFDPLCGTFDKSDFKKSYKFIDDIKQNERKTLRDELKNTDDPAKQRKIKYLIQRLDNQLREKERREKVEERDNKEKKIIKDKLRKGEKPEYEKKSTKKIMDLLNQYEELKESKQLAKHIEKKSKKLARKDFKKIIKEMD
ncbi:uncharacterized protein CBL_03629 [Carabus blaptoides fortunei]